MKQLQHPLLLKNFGPMHLEYLGGYYIPLCERCVCRIREINDYILSEAYKDEIKTPYTIDKIISKHLDHCVQNGFFVRHAILAHAKISDEIEKFFQKNKNNKISSNVYHKELKRLISLENARNEYIQIKINRLCKEGYPDGPSKNQEPRAFTDIFFYPFIEGENQPILTGRIIYP